MKRKQRVPKELQGTFTRLEELMAEGSIFKDGGTYMGICSNGVEVQLNVEGQEEQLESYLQSYPNPSDW